MLKSSVSSLQMKMFNQTIELCKKNINDNRTLMTIITQADYGGYCSKYDDYGMTIHIFGNIKNFYNFLQA